MSKQFYGLTTVNIELSSRCNKNCWMCGRRKIDKDYPEVAMNYGDMEMYLVKKIAEQLPSKIICQFHSNGESLLHPNFGDAVSLFNRQIKCMNTNGKLIIEKHDEIIDNLDTITISVIEKDSEGDEQFELVKEFLDIKKNRKPFMIYRLLGNIENRHKWESLPGIIVDRILHSPMGSFKYTKKVTKPEIGICLDLLNHLVINRFGDVSICVRFDVNKLGVIGNINSDKLIDIWNGNLRSEWIQYHIEGKRQKAPLCKTCEFWGIPRG
jgi:radical SAM protein with 4Fe4S-binding SPASM domain